MKVPFSLKAKYLAAGVALALAIPVSAQLIYGNTFPFWNVNGPLVVTGDTTLTGGTNAITGTTTIGAGATLTSPTITGATLTTAGLTSPAITTSITTPTASFTAFAGATTLMTLGGTGASASTFMPSTLDTTTSTTGAIRTSGGISAAKNMVVGAQLIIAATATPLAADACTAGRFVWDASYVYVCTATGVWKRASLTGGY